MTQKFVNMVAPLWNYAVRDDAEIRQYGRAFMELCQKQFNN